jgi:mannan endo-1,4-beta-mannosidase
MLARFLMLSSLALAVPAGSVPLSSELDPAKTLGMISELTYGTNMPVGTKLKLHRHGGNRMTGYNWETNASSAGNDYKNNSDYWLNQGAGFPMKQLPPATLAMHSLKQDREAGMYSIYTVPMAGYVAADGNGEVSSSERAPSRRWVKVEPKKGQPFAASPSLTDGVVYVDEFADFLKRQNLLPLFFSLDNEPGLWASTHSRIHPKPVTYEEMLSKSIATASALLDVAPQSRIVGGVTYGWFENMSLQKAPDFGTYNPKYGWYLGYLLSGMKEASDKQGRRLLHLLDVHWYPEAQGGGKRITLVGGSALQDSRNQALIEARLQAPRSLWDPDYIEDSWIAKDVVGGPIKALVRIKEAIAKYYPGTMPAMLEWNYGGEEHISGGLAAADVIGIFGKYGVASCYWALSGKIPFYTAAFKMYLDFDGKGSRFGDVALDLASSNKALLSIHAAKDSKDPKRITVVVIHKHQSRADDFTLQIHGFNAASIRAFRMEGKDSDLKPANTAKLSPTGFSDTLPAMSATLYEIRQK